MLTLVALKVVEDKSRRLAQSHVRPAARICQMIGVTPQVVMLLLHGDVPAAIHQPLVPQVLGGTVDLAFGTGTIHLGKQHRG